MNRFAVLLLAVASRLLPTNTLGDPTPPVAPRREHTMVWHGLYVR